MPTSLICIITFKIQEMFYYEQSTNDDHDIDWEQWSNDDSNDNLCWTTDEEPMDKTEYEKYKHDEKDNTQILEDKYKENKIGKTILNGKLIYTPKKEYSIYKSSKEIKKNKKFNETNVLGGGKLDNERKINIDKHNTLVKQKIQINPIRNENVVGSINVLGGGNLDNERKKNIERQNLYSRINKINNKIKNLKEKILSYEMYLEGAKKNHDEGYAPLVNNIQIEYVKFKKLKTEEFNKKLELIILQKLFLLYP